MTFQELNCRALDHTLALLVAMLIDPELALSELPAQVVALGLEDRAAQLLEELESSPPAQSRRFPLDIVLWRRVRVEPCLA
ncbi:MAG: hypothetical protein RL385_1677 [Pseudomonadota bacterium]|jgi:hypothetical protein